MRSNTPYCALATLSSNAVPSPSRTGLILAVARAILWIQPWHQPIPTTVIKPASGFEAFDFAELKRYKDLFYFLVLRDVKVLYAQTVLGFAWAIFNPAVQIILFTLIFGRVAGVPTNGTPYLLFSTVAIIPWTYMSEAMKLSSQSLVAGQSMLAKVYFPRIIYPLTPIAAKLVDFAISLLLLAGVMIYYRVAPGWNVLLLPAVRRADDGRSDGDRAVAVGFGHSFP